MRKARLIPLLILLMLCLCAGASASSAASGGPGGQVYIASVYDAYGKVTTLTDGDTSTTWTRSAAAYSPDLTINLYSATVGEIWLRSGHCYTQTYYNHFDRPSVVAVTLWYNADRYTSASVTYRYRLTDAYRPYTMSSEWNSGYQRLLLPQKYNGVTRIELTIESTINGYGSTGATLTDVIIAQGQHATATPAYRGTATPRPHVEYVTPTPGPTQNVQYLTPVPTATPLVQLITPTPTLNIIVPTREVVLLTPVPTSTPLVQLLTPVPTSTPLVELLTPTPAPDLPTFPSEGIPAALLRSMATRTGPGTRYDEPGTFFREGSYVNVISKVFDSSGSLWWYQVEFYYKNQWYRAYTPANRIDLNRNYVPDENTDAVRMKIQRSSPVYFGPGTEFATFWGSNAAQGANVMVYIIEEDWAQIEYRDYGLDIVRRGWIPLDCLSD
ncbi:MAG: hypothetical protein IJZ74_11135 [Clostridia bacterium]|nr:hypothetical protein [Clostridia bacterium]